MVTATLSLPFLEGSDLTYEQIHEHLETACGNPTGRLWVDYHHANNHGPSFYMSTVGRQLAVNARPETYAWLIFLQQYIGSKLDIQVGI